MFTEEGILRDGDVFKDVSVFEYDGLTNLLFGMEDVKLNIGKLAIWRLQSHSTFGGTWLSDYLVNNLGAVEGKPHATLPERETIIKANYVYTGSGKEILVNTIEHPADRETITEILQKAGINGTQGRIFFVDGLESVIPKLEDMIPELVEIDEMNYLAVKISKMNESERKLFAAIIAEESFCGSLPKIIDLTENLGCFELRRVDSPGEYGDILLDINRDEFAAALGGVERSTDPSFRALAKYIRQLESLADIDNHGLVNLELADAGDFVPFDYLIELDAYETAYKGPEDIPSEYRIDVKAQQEPSFEPEPPLKVEKPSVISQIAEAREAQRRAKRNNQDAPASGKSKPNGPER
jgi:hypothetical protein